MRVIEEDIIIQKILEAVQAAGVGAYEHGSSHNEAAAKEDEDQFCAYIDGKGSLPLVTVGALLPLTCFCGAFHPALLFTFRCFHCCRLRVYCCLI